MIEFQTRPKDCSICGTIGRVWLVFNTWLCWRCRQFVNMGK